MSNTSLATRCPACHTVFRVVQDQLRVSEGWVRCGRCSEVFNASENFVDVDAIAAPAPPPQAPPAAQTREPRRSPPEPSTAARAAPVSTRPTRAPEPPRAEPTFDGARDNFENASTPSVDEWADSGMDAEHRGQPSIRMPPRASQPRGFEQQLSVQGPVREDMPMFETRSAYDMADIAWARQQTPGGSAAQASRFTDSTYQVSRLGAAPNSRPAHTDASGMASDTPSHTPSHTPSFVREAERAERWRSAPMRAALAGAAGLLAIGLLAQVTISYRDLVAARFPASKPLLLQACAALGCTLEAARAIDSLAVENSGLVRQGRSNLYKLQLTLRNRAGIEVAVPAMDITLTDVRGAVIARKVLRASDMGSTIATLGAGRELALLATLQSATPGASPGASLGTSPGTGAPGASADVIAGYTVELFYP
jgi:predicted Zn finger-like uncharacterized protein